ncbi:MAG: hypothetical protein NTY48_02040 [Candidatus Diapherotrites archaeon]|nr:hypothetical protein [Candidatus Diapherotrites archaeon]
MVGPQRKQRRPTIPKLSGTGFKTISELKSEEENNQLRKRIHHYTPKKKVILLPGPAPETNKQDEKKE